MFWELGATRKKIIVVSVHYIHCGRIMNHDVKQSKGLTHLTLVLNTGKETAKEKEGKKQLCHIWLHWHTISIQGD